MRKRIESKTRHFCTEVLPGVAKYRLLDCHSHFPSVYQLPREMQEPPLTLQGWGVQWYSLRCVLSTWECYPLNDPNQDSAVSAVAVPSAAAAGEIVQTQRWHR